MSVRLLHIFGAILTLLLILALVGCGSSSEPTAIMEGVVKYKGTPLTGGIITLIGAGDKTKMATCGINSDGTFKINNAPLGDVKIGVEGPGPPSDASKGKQAAVVLPKAYANPERSGLTYTVKEGLQTHDVELK